MLSSQYTNNTDNNRYQWRSNQYQWREKALQCLFSEALGTGPDTQNNPVQQEEILDSALWLCCEILARVNCHATPSALQKEVAQFAEYLRQGTVTAWESVQEQQMPREGDIIRDARQQLGLSQAELGAMIGRSPNYISRLESGAAYLLDEDATILADILHLDANVLRAHPADRLRDFIAQRENGQ